MGIKCLIVLSLISCVAFAQSKPAPAQVKSSTTPPPPRTELSTEEIIELVGMAQEMDRILAEGKKQEGKMKARFDQLKAQHNAQDCEGMSNSYLWQGCKTTEQKAKK